MCFFSYKESLLQGKLALSSCELSSTALHVQFLIFSMSGIFGAQAP